MPKRKFVYSREAGKVVEVTDEHTKELCDEISESVSVFNEDFTHIGKSKHNCAPKWGYASEAMAVSPKDVKRAQEILAKHGVKTDYDKLGRPIMRDRAHRKAHMKALGFYDRNSGYGDQAPEHFTMDYHPDNVAARQKEFMANLERGRVYF